MNKIKQKLIDGDKIILGGVHDVLSSRIIGNCGFDGAWLSGLGVSVAKRGVPDASIITPSEISEICFNITSATDLPVIIDMDSGYGNAVNAFYSAKDFEKSGASGICIEDNVFPKCNSFYNAEDRPLEPLSSMVGKIDAIKSAVSNDFCVIARCEGLIVGLQQNEIEDRCHAYKDAGADAIVIHTSDWDKLINFLTNWERPRIPLVVIPTKIPSIAQSELLKHFDVIIYANQLLRASIKFSEQVMSRIIDRGLSLELEKEISSMEEVFKYNQMGKLTELENEFIK